MKLTASILAKIYSPFITAKEFCNRVRGEEGVQASDNVILSCLNSNVERLVGKYPHIQTKETTKGTVVKFKVIRSKNEIVWDDEDVEISAKETEANDELLEVTGNPGAFHSF
jgi:hypothetical protein